MVTMNEIGYLIHTLSLGPVMPYEWHTLKQATAFSFLTTIASRVAMVS